MSKELAYYRHLEGRLWMTRWKYSANESAEEDAILDEMESIWLKLSDEEQTGLREEGPQCWPGEGALIPVPVSWPYEGFQSPEDAILLMDAA